MITALAITTVLIASRIRGANILFCNSCFGGLVFATGGEFTAGVLFESPWVSTNTTLTEKNNIVKKSDLNVYPLSLKNGKISYFISGNSPQKRVKFAWNL